MYTDNGNMILLAREEKPQTDTERMHQAIMDIMKLPKHMEGWDTAMDSKTEESEKAKEEEKTAKSYQKISLATKSQEKSTLRKMAAIVEDILKEYRERKSDFTDEDETYLKMMRRIDEVKDIFASLDEDPNADITASDDSEGLIGAFKLRASDEAVDRMSRRRRRFSEEEMVEPFMRSMPYS